MTVERLQKLGVEPKRITQMFTRGLLPRARTQLGRYEELLRAGEDVSVARLVHAILGGKDLRLPASGERVMPAAETHELGCPTCGLTWFMVGHVWPKCKGEMVPITAYEKLRAYQRAQRRVKAQV